jgi:hypothetical protein
VRIGGTGLNEKAKFCSHCGAAVSAGMPPAEYKQVTVLFVEVVISYRGYINRRDPGQDSHRSVRIM